MEEPLVSVLCITYNHARYIRETLDGIMVQKTNFPYEVLIHDDASTDGTADIIREYETKYPEIIKPIYQTRNLYSQGIEVEKIEKEYQFSRVKGRYIAICEGDDYWTDPQKLQRQFDALEAHPELDMCAHGTIKRYPSGREVPLNVVSQPVIITTEQIILGGGLSVSSCSLMYRKAMLDKPWRFFSFWSYDYPTKILGSLRGGILCLPYTMAVYRFMSGPDAWTSRVLKDREKEISHTKKRLQLLDYLNEDTNFQFDGAIQTAKKKFSFDLLWYQEDYRAMRRREYSELYRKLPLKKRAFVCLGGVCPGIIKILHEELVNKLLKERI